MDVMSSASSHERLSSVLGQSPQGSDNSGLEVTWGLLIRPQHRAVASPGPGAWNALLNSLLAKKHENKTAQLSKGIMEMLEKMALDTRQGQGQARRDGWGGFRAHLLSYASRKCYFLDASLSRVILSSSPAVTPTGGCTNSSAPLAVVSKSGHFPPLHLESHGRRLSGSFPLSSAQSNHAAASHVFENPPMASHHT